MRVGHSDTVLHTNAYGPPKPFSGSSPKANPGQVLVLESKPDYCLSLELESLLSGIDTAAKEIDRSALVAS